MLGSFVRILIFSLGFNRHYAVLPVKYIEASPLNPVNIAMGSKTLQNYQKVMVVFITFLLIFVTVHIVGRDIADHNSFSSSAYFVLRENKRLVGYNFATSASTSELSCTLICLRDSRCSSANFRKSNNGCELNEHLILPDNGNAELEDQPDFNFLLVLKVGYMIYILIYIILRRITDYRSLLLNCEMKVAALIITENGVNIIISRAV